MKTKNTKGFTVTELMVSLALLLIVLSVGYMFFSYGANAFAKGEEQSIVQGNVRPAIGVITRELRNINEMSFVNTAPAAGNYNYIVYNSSTKTIKIYDKTAAVTFESNPSINTFQYAFENVNGQYVMTCTVGAIEGSRTYSTSSKVFLANLKAAPVDLNKGYTTIKYKQP